MQVVDARRLRSHHHQLCKECSKFKDGMKNNNVAVVVGDHGSSRKKRIEYEVDDFRPTSPGHSPGVGHSINN
ncbi:putative encoded peptide [Senna tora]|uniref:Putative encoded peptide n=1 Tax=Senna tora TaxID=362788 RepID=A0A834TVS3_9FABA|nr:putative encoded peptide [Senna tora]